MARRWLLAALLLAACDDESGAATAVADAGADAAVVDFEAIGQVVDAERDAGGPPDARSESRDAGDERDTLFVPPPDAGPTDAAPPDAAGDLGPPAPELHLDFVEIPQDSGAIRLTDIAFLPAPEGDFLLLCKDGVVMRMRLEGDSARALGSFEIPETHSVTDSGAIGLAVDPAFAENGFFYVSLATGQETNVIYRYRMDDADFGRTHDSQTVVIEIDAEGSPRPWHNLGSLGFTREGYLYTTMGDKKIADVPQDPRSPLGSVLRLIPSHAPEGGYTVPVDNPWADGSGHPAVYGKGLRSPWRVTYARRQFFFGDVGEDTYEELNRVQAPGQNFGWRLAEGPCEVDCAGLTDPWTGYDHGSRHPFRAEDPEATGAVRRSINVGLVYQPRPDDPYQGRWDDVLTFGDTFVGYVRAMRIRDNDEGASWHAGHIELVTGWAQAPDGYVYVVTLGSWPMDAPEQPAGLYRAVLAD